MELHLESNCVKAALLQLPDILGELGVVHLLVFLDFLEEVGRSLLQLGKGARLAGEVFEIRDMHPIEVTDLSP